MRDSSIFWEPCQYQMHSFMTLIPYMGEKLKKMGMSGIKQIADRLGMKCTVLPSSRSVKVQPEK